MAYVVTEKCIQCKHTDCVEICPVSCFHEGPNFVVINPNECIDCNLCVTECPVNAIYPEESLPQEYQQFAQINKNLSKIWPSILEKKQPLPDFETWATVKNKLDKLIQN
jgi:ferredoxin